MTTWTLILLFMSVDRPSRAVSVATVPGFSTLEQCRTAMKALSEVDDRMGVGCFAQGVEAPPPACHPVHWPPFPSCPDGGACIVSVPVFTLTAVPDAGPTVHGLKLPCECDGVRLSRTAAKEKDGLCWDGRPILCRWEP